MNNIEELIEALNIFNKYSEGKYQEMGAEHDEFFAGPFPDVVSEEDLARLEELGWLPAEDWFRLFV